MLPESATVSRRGRPRGRSHLAPVLSEEYLRREYEGAGRSTIDLAGELGCSPKTVRRYLDLYGIPLRRRGQRRARFPELQSASFLLTAYVVDGRSPAEIATQIGCSRSAVVAALQRASIDRPGGRSADLDAEFLRRAYLIGGRSTVQIAAQVGCGATTVARSLRRQGIPLRRRGGSGSRRPVRVGLAPADTGRDG